MATRYRSLVRPRTLLLGGVVLTLSALFTFQGSCAPVGGYDGPAGIRHFILEWSTVGVAYGNGCSAQIATLPLAIGFTSLVVGACFYWEGR